MIMASGLDAFDVVVYRLAISSPFLFLAFALRRKGSLGVSPSVVTYLALGGFATFSAMISYYYAVSLIGVALAAVLTYLAPVFTLISSPFLLGERVSSKKVISASIVLIGCFLAVKAYSASYLKLNELGILIGIMCGLSYSLMTLTLKLLMKRGYEDMFKTVTFMLVFSTVFCLPFTALHPLKPVLDLEALALILVLAFPLTSLAYSLFVLGLSKAEASKSNIASSIEITTAVAVGILLLGEALEPIQILGALLVIVGVSLLYLRD